MELRLKLNSCRSRAKIGELYNLSRERVIATLLVYAMGLLSHFGGGYLALMFVRHSNYSSSFKSSISATLR